MNLQIIVKTAFECIKNLPVEGGCLIGERDYIRVNGGDYDLFFRCAVMAPFVSEHLVVVPVIHTKSFSEGIDKALVQLTAYPFLREFFINAETPDFYFFSPADMRFSPSGNFGVVSIDILKQFLAEDKHADCLRRAEDLDFLLSNR
jgi:hypothetical protein